MTVSTSRGAYHHGQLREALLDAAYALLSQRPYHEISLRQVARQAGVSHAAPYNHFPDRPHLLVALAGRCMRQFYVFQFEATERERDPGAKLLALGEAYVGYAVEHPNEFQLIFDPQISPPGDSPPELAPWIDLHRELLLSCVTGVQRAGLMAPGDPVALASALWSTVHGLAHLILLGHIPRAAAKDILGSLLAPTGDGESIPGYHS